MVAKRQDFTMEQGATFSQNLYLKQGDGVTPFSLIYVTAVKSSIRETYDGEEIESFVCDVISPLDGIIKMSMTALISAGLLNTEYVYDLIVESTNDVVRIIYGKIKVIPSVTRDETNGGGVPI